MLSNWCNREESSIFQVHRYLIIRQFLNKLSSIVTSGNKWESMPACNNNNNNNSTKKKQILLHKKAMTMGRSVWKLWSRTEHNLHIITYLLHKVPFFSCQIATRSAYSLTEERRRALGKKLTLAFLEAKWSLQSLRFIHSSTRLDYFTYWHTQDVTRGITYTSSLLSLWTAAKKISKKGTNRTFHYLSLPFTFLPRSWKKARHKFYLLLPASGHVLFLLPRPLLAFYCVITNEPTIFGPQFFFFTPVLSLYRKTSHRR